MSINVFLRPQLLAAITGYSRRTLERDARRFSWPWTTNSTSPLPLYDLAAVEKSYGVQISAQQIFAALAETNAICVKEDSENVG